MRRRVPGMDELDNAILEFYHDLDRPAGAPVALGPTQVWHNLAVLRDVTDKRQNTVSRHMMSLYEDGLLVKTDESRGLYGISELGVRYVEGDLSDDEREDLREKRTS